MKGRGFGVFMAILVTCWAPVFGQVVFVDGFEWGSSCAWANDLWYPDVDGDSFGDEQVVGIPSDCPPPTTMMENNLDCDDQRFDVHPGAPEYCDGLDNDCDGQVDEGCGSVDADGDGYNDWVDCDDSNPNVYPGALEICNGVDDDCDSLVDEDPPALLCPPGSNVESTVCAGAAGCVLTCSPQWSDGNGLFEDGCECQQIDVEPNDTCSEFSDVGALNGNTSNLISVEGTVIVGDYDWYRIRVEDDPEAYPDNVDGVDIYFEDYSGDAYLEVYRDGCPGVGILGLCDVVNSYECAACGDPNVNDTHFYYIRVYLRPGVNACVNYTLMIRTQPALSYPWCAYCGDGYCGPFENLTTCYEDCNSCGNGVCETGETALSCNEDCGYCGDGICGTIETPSSCNSDCGYCGDGTCGTGEYSGNCQPDCGYCGDGICGLGESAWTCWVDCV